MIRRDDDEGWPREGREPIEERAERAIDGRDFTVVRLRRVLRGEIGWRLVRRVGIEYVHPREELRGLAADPIDRAPGDHVRGPLGHRERHITFEFGYLVVVDVEAGRQAEPLREGEAADEGAGRKPQGLESRRERPGPVLDAIAAVVAHAVLVRKLPGQDGGVGGQRHDRVRVRERKARAARGQPIEVRRGGTAAVRPKRVGAQRVDGDEEDVLVRGLSDGVRAAAPPPERDGADRGQQRATGRDPAAARTSGGRRRSDGRPFRSRAADGLAGSRRAHGAADPATAIWARTCWRTREDHPDA